MQVSVEQSSTLERKITVSVDEDQIAEKVTDRLKELGRNVKIDGFRPGKVPFRVIRQRFGSRVREEVVGEVLRTSFSDAITQESLRPVGEPNIDPVNADAGQGLSYTATFEIFPDVTLAPVEELNFERPVCEIADSDLDKLPELTESEGEDASSTIDYRSHREDDEDSQEEWDMHALMTGEPSRGEFSMLGEMKNAVEENATTGCENSLHAHMAEVGTKARYGPIEYLDGQNGE